ncbi:MAG: copper oxidase [Chloroflexia bacterium]
MKKHTLRALLPLLLPLILLALVLSACDLFGGPGGNSAPAGPTPEPTHASALLPGETPGILTSENPHADEAMEALPIEGVPAATETEGGQPLAYTLDGDVKVFNLTAKAVRWHILEGVEVTAFTYNGMVPGPLLRFTEGDTVRVVLKNELPEATTIHWHGLIVPNNMDGVPGMTQPAIQPGETFTYEFTANASGTYWYHSHTASDRQIGVGLHAPIIIDPKAPNPSMPDLDMVLMLEEWRIIDGVTYPSMPATGMDANFFTFNGKAFPDTPDITLKQGQKLRLRLIGAGQLGHPIHIHGPAFKIVSTDGHPVPEAAQLTKDTVWVAPGERYDIEWVASAPGMWMLHCHIPHHTTNDHEEPGGLMMMIHVEP